jgi:hypothetical protein
MSEPKRGPTVLNVDPAAASARRRYPSISLLVPLDGPSPWQVRLRNLQSEVEGRLRSEFGENVDPDILARLDAAVSDADVPVGARSLAVFVDADGAQCVGVAVPVRERAVIDDTFATRDLVHHELRSPRYWVLALSLDGPRLFHGHGPVLHPHHLELRDVGDDNPPRGRDRRGKDRSDIVEARRARRLRALDLALADILAASPDPLIVVGAEPTVSRFVGRTRHVARIEGVVRRAPCADLEELAQLVAPALSDVLGERRVLALAALDRAVSAGTAISGIDQVWRLAQRGGGGLLIAEQGFEHPAALSEDGTLTAAEDPTANDVVDDVVDDVIELVLASGGRVELVPDGTLASHDRIALVPMLRSRKG